MKILLVVGLCLFTVMSSGTAFGALVNLEITSYDPRSFYTMPYGQSDTLYFNLTNSTNAPWAGYRIVNNISYGELSSYSGPGTVTHSPPYEVALSVTDLNIPVGGIYSFSLFMSGATGDIPHWDVDLVGIPLAASAPVPIPGALVLFGSGLLGLVGIGRKRFKK